MFLFYNTLIYISTKWCAPCRAMNPILESLEDDDDVQNVFTNANISEDMLEELDSNI